MIYLVMAKMQKGGKHLPETIEKIRKSCLGKNLGKKWTSAQRKRISEARTNKPKKEKTISTNGYVRIFSPHHPYCQKSKYVLEHRLIMEKHLKRYLKKDEVIHHKNGIRTDNRFCNLVLLKNISAHQKLHKSKNPQALH